MVSKTATLGIDIGSSTTYTAYVGKGLVDMVQNEVSNRFTPSMVGFTDKERLLGDTALSQIRSNLKSTCRNFKHLIGRQVQDPTVEIEKFWSPASLENSGGDIAYVVKYKGEPKSFTVAQVTAMYLTKLLDISEKWCEAKVSDVVIAVPSDYTDIHRQAILDAAKIAGLSVLRVMNEHTATALAYGIYRSNDFDMENPCTVVFCSIGHSIFSVSVVQFFKGKLTVVCERSARIGGRDMDECLMREFAAQFQKKTGCDPLSDKKALYKLEDAVGKTKKTLSANATADISVECLMEDEDFASSVTRADFEAMCEPMKKRMQAVFDAVKADMGASLDQIDFVEVVGGAHRVPFIKQMCKDALGKELSFTMNAEESVSRGCALQAAILSPLYKVRDFKVEDAISHGISVGWKATSTDVGPTANDEEGEMRMIGNEGEFKTAQVFPAGSMMNIIKILTFSRKEAFDLSVEYTEPSKLPSGTPKELGVYRIELPPQNELKQVKVKVKVSVHGTFQVESAQMVEEEEYNETVKEKRELPQEELAETPKDQATETVEGATNEESKKKEPEKKYEWVNVQKTKKRTKKTDVVVTAKGKPGLSEAEIRNLHDEETAMQIEMKEIIETDERRNDLESYIFNMRSKIEPGNEYGEFISGPEREKFSADLTKAEDWLYDTYEGTTKAQFVEKLNELKVIGDAVAWRHKEFGMRPDWINAVTGTIANYRAAGENPGEKYGHIAPEKLGEIISLCADLEKWLTDMRTKQDKMPKHERSVLICAEMEKKNHELAKRADQILKELKPAPPRGEEPKKVEAPKDESKPGAGNGAEAADGPQNMDVD